MEKESSDYNEDQSQEVKLEEETIYSQKLNYNDSRIMNRFHEEEWSKKWSFAEKFKDQRLRFFAARHIYRNYPEELPEKFLNYCIKKFQKDLFFREKKFITIPAAMEEADSLS